MESIFNELEQEEKIVIFLLGALHAAPIRTKTKLQKILFLVSKVFGKYADLLEYEPHLFGPYSENLDYILEDLIKLGLVDKTGTSYFLTAKGLVLFKKIKPDRKLTQVIEDFKDFLNDLPDSEVLTFIYSSYPEFIEESAKWDELKPNRKRVAISLLKKGKISFAKAAQVSGLSEKEFEEFLYKNRIKWR